MSDSNKPNSSNAQEDDFVAQRGILNSGFGKFLLSRKWPIALGFVLFLGTILAHYWAPISTVTGLSNFPEQFDVGPKVSRWVDSIVDWAVVNWDPFFRAINVGLLRYFLLPLESWLLLLPWWLVIAIISIISFRVVSPVFSVIATLLMLVTAFLGLFDLAMATLALVIVATLISVLIGIPTGIIASRSQNFDVILRPILDGMQTMPSFVYLIPVLMLFGLGKVPAVLATVIYAVPPIIRLTNLGIRQVDTTVVEAGKAFGATSTQLLIKVQIPLALPTIMAGLNQTIMMALAMVVIASMIGAKGLGIEVLNGIARLDVGRGLMGGIGIVVMAVIIDRVTQGIADSKKNSNFS